MCERVNTEEGPWVRRMGVLKQRRWDAETREKEKAFEGQMMRMTASGGGVENEIVRS